MRISDWSSDVCSSDLRSTARRRIREARTADGHVAGDAARRPARAAVLAVHVDADADRSGVARARHRLPAADRCDRRSRGAGRSLPARGSAAVSRSEEHTSELQSLLRISYAVFCLKKKKGRQQLIIWAPSAEY